MKSEFDKDKQEAVSRALQMTLAELRSTLEQAHSEREKAVQIVREEWQNRLDEALKASKANAAKSMMALKTEQEVAVSAIRAKYEEEISELRSCVSEKVDRVAELVEQLETEREERRQFEKQISEARQKRKESFEKMSQLYEFGASPQNDRDLLSSPSETNGGGGSWFSNIFGRRGSGSNRNRHDAAAYTSRAVVASNMSPRRNPRLGQMYATLLESYAAMMNQVESLGDQRLQEQERAEDLEEQLAQASVREAELQRKLNTCMKRLEDAMAQPGVFIGSGVEKDENRTVFRERLVELEAQVTLLTESLEKSQEENKLLRKSSSYRPTIRGQQKSASAGNPGARVMRVAIRGGSSPRSKKSSSRIFGSEDSQQQAPVGPVEVQVRADDARYE